MSYTKQQTTVVERIKRDFGMDVDFGAKEKTVVTFNALESINKIIPTY